eukprot:Phypoly_transcript_21603.p1 GENE.Phypoly_transcript_21603~~Phypoly_transcript_21603.p1  ORF type:complete len:199 (+),score=26.62 Phypoly_transcript_21603:52-597(+)
MANFVDLSGDVDFTGSQVLGSAHPLSNIIKADDNELFIESDCDEQLIITIRFQSTVKINSLRIFAPETGAAPRRIKIFANQDNAGFEDLESLTPIQEFTLDHAQLANPLQLKFVKFQNVNSFSVFVVDNLGNETSRINRIVVYGQPKEGMKINELKKVEGSKFAPWDEPRGVQVNNTDKGQ